MSLHYPLHGGQAESSPETLCAEQWLHYPGQAFGLNTGPIIRDFAYQLVAGYPGSNSDLPFLPIILRQRLTGVVENIDDCAADIFPIYRDLEIGV